MTGRWLGFGKRFQINNGDWDAEPGVPIAPSARTLKKYELIGIAGP